MAKFTDKFIAALKLKAARYEVWESGGFGIRVSPGRGKGREGRKSWVWVYHFDGRPRRMTLGTYPKLGLADAHVKLADARTLLARGIDPAAKAVADNKAERVAETVEELAKIYLEKWARPRKRSASEDERILRKDVIPAWGSRKAKNIARRDVVALLDAIVDRGSPIAANRTLAVIRRMFGWALSRDIVPSSPCVAVKAPAKERRRDRVLSVDEIAAFWRALERSDLAMSSPIRLALKLQLVTAQRKGEVIGAEWNDFDLHEAVWTIPAAKTKNGMPHRVPLSSLAVAVLGEIETATGSHPDPSRTDPPRWLFPSPRAAKPITGPAVDHAMRNNRGALGIGEATPHDLRRTAASHLTSIGISRLVVSKILNHAEPGVTAVYDRHSYDAEKGIALAAWGARIEEVIGARPERDNVVRLPVAEAPDLFDHCGVISDPPRGRCG
jgi:integrase